MQYTAVLTMRDTEFSNVHRIRIHVKENASICFSLPFVFIQSLNFSGTLSPSFISIQTSHTYTHRNICTEMPAKIPNTIDRNRRRRHDTHAVWERYHVSINVRDDIVYMYENFHVQCCSITYIFMYACTKRFLHICMHHTNT